MEFYKKEIANALEIERFNSQRDGILLYAGTFSADPDTWFQFPTGWNSTD